MTLEQFLLMEPTTILMVTTLVALIAGVCIGLAYERMEKAYKRLFFDRTPYRMTMKPSDYKPGQTVVSYKWVTGSAGYSILTEIVEVTAPGEYIARNSAAHRQLAFIVEEWWMMRRIRFK